MNKCVICTFVKMVLNGLWDNTCPSIDKTKKEKPLGFWKGVKELLGALVLMALVLFVLVAVYKFLLWVDLWKYLLLLWYFIRPIFEVIGWVVLGLLLLMAVLGLFVGTFEWIKTRIICIKAYWRKAKEECE